MLVGAIPNLSDVPRTRRSASDALSGIPSPENYASLHVACPCPLTRAAHPACRTRRPLVGHGWTGSLLWGARRAIHNKLLPARFHPNPLWVVGGGVRGNGVIVMCLTGPLHLTASFAFAAVLCLRNRCTSLFPTHPHLFPIGGSQIVRGGTSLSGCLVYPGARRGGHGSC